MLLNHPESKRSVLGGLDWLAERPRVTIWLTALLAFTGCVSYALLNGIPQPAIHDEFSYLLAGDTFASGRLTNPTHPMWRHFETFHVLQEPTYASKYPPGQGIFLALGQILGHPILGVWLSLALMAAGISWTLYQWLPPKWALLGSVLAIVQIGFPTYWGQTYLGGAVAALGGALVYGSLRAAARRPRLRYGVLFGIGATLLATTRPLEGMLAGFPAIVVLVGLLLEKGRQDRVQLMRRVLVPATMIVIATAGGLAYQNWRVTGDPLRLPYQAYNDAYHMGAHFPWQEPSVVNDYRHREFSEFKRVWIFERSEAQRQHFALATLFKFLRLQNFYLGPGMIALFAISAKGTGRWIALPILSTAIVVGAVMLTKGAYPHYAAPVSGLVLILVLEGLRRLSGSRVQVHGPALAAVILLAYLPYLALRPSLFDLPETKSFSEDRKRILDALKTTQVDDLVIVRYGDNHNFHHEWVYNRAVIDSAEVIWARDMSPEENRELIQYFEGHRVWLLEVDELTRLRPYREDSPEP